MHRFVALVAVLASLPVGAEEWPKWRGPGGDGISRDAKATPKWPEKGPKVLWRAEAGDGYASPVAAKGRVYQFAQFDDDEVLVAHDARTGAVAWRKALKGGWTRSYEGTRATPTIAGDRIYTFGGTGDLVARDLATGELAWRVAVLGVTGGARGQV